MCQVNIYFQFSILAFFMYLENSRLTLLFICILKNLMWISYVLSKIACFLYNRDKTTPHSVNGAKTTYHNKTTAISQPQSTEKTNLILVVIIPGLTAIIFISICALSLRILSTFFLLFIYYRCYKKICLSCHMKYFTILLSAVPIYLYISTQKRVVNFNIARSIMWLCLQTRSWSIVFWIIVKSQRRQIPSETELEKREELLSGTEKEKQVIKG